MSQLGRGAGLTGFVELARETGIDPYRLAAAAGVPRAALADPELIISAEAISRLLDMAAKAANAPDFGLRMAQKRRLSSLGPLGLAVRHQPTLRGAFQIAVDYGWVRNDAFVVALEDEGDITVLRVGSVTWGSPAAMELTLGILFRAAVTLRGPAWRPLEVRFMHRAPADLGPHRRTFGVTPLFEQDFVGMVLDRADLEVPIAGADAALAAQATRYLEHLAEGRAPGLRDRVREFVLTQLPSGGCSVDRIAHQLGFDRRTLHRRLTAEATSYSEVLATARAELAAMFLANSERPLLAIAEALGFASLSAFAHWFRRTFGCTASAYRAGRQPPGYPRAADRTRPAAGHAAAATAISSGSRST